MVGPNYNQKENWLLYTNNEGGGWEIVGDFGIENWLELKRKGYFDLAEGDGLSRVYPAAASYVVAVDTYDFIIAELGGIKEKTYVRQKDYKRFTRSNGKGS